MTPSDLKRFAIFLANFLEDNYGGDFVDKTTALNSAHLEYACKWDTPWEWQELDSARLHKEIEMYGIYYDPDLDAFLV